MARKKKETPEIGKKKQQVKKQVIQESDKVEELRNKIKDKAQTNAIGEKLYYD